MASFKSQPPQRMRARWRLVVAFVAGCCLLAWEPIAAAPAKSGHGRAVPTSTSTSSTTNAPAADTESAEDCCATAPAEDGSAPAIAQPEVSAAKQPRRSQAKAGGTRARRRAASNGAAQTRAQGAPAASGQSQSSAHHKKEKTEGKKENKGGKKGKSGGKTGKTHESSEAPATESGSKNASKSTGAEAVASSAAVEAAPPASAPSAVSAGAPAAIAPAPPSLGTPAVRKPSRGKGAHDARAKARVSATSASAAPALAAASVPLASASTRPNAGSGRHAAAKGRRAQAGLAPLVTTVTKIVGVVPLAVRILIGALAALALALAARSRLAARRARRLEHQRGQLLEDVGLLQAALLPAPPARLGPVGTSVAYRPADGPGAGGDFYDVFALEDGQVAVIVGDVSGHGRGALPHTALLRFTIRAYLEAGLSPRRALQTAGNVLERQLGGSFATVVAATYHPRERTLTYACAGHPPPVVLGSAAAGTDADASTAQLAAITACSSPPIGAGMRTGMRQTVVSVPGPSRICFHTDGVTEARVAGELYGEERLARGLRELGPEATAPALLDRVADEADARPDDMAACLLRIEDGAGMPSVLCEELELDEEVGAAERTERFLDACGVEAWEVSEVMRAARSGAARRDPVMLELRFAGGLPEVAVRHDNVLHPAALVAAGGSRVPR